MQFPLGDPLRSRSTAVSPLTHLQVLSYSRTAAPLFLHTGAGTRPVVGFRSFTAGAPNQLGIAPGTETSIHFPSCIEKYLSSHSTPGKHFVILFVCLFVLTYLFQGSPLDSPPMHCLQHTQCRQPQWHTMAARCQSPWLCTYHRYVQSIQKEKCKVCLYHRQFYRALAPN